MNHKRETVTASDDWQLKTRSSNNVGPLKYSAMAEIVVLPRVHHTEICNIYRIDI